ncbi:MAG: alpha/beta fold hydrolase [Tepidiformaceae bacterium]
MNYEIDVRHVLPAVRVPTLVLHSSGDRAVDVRFGRYLAEHIDGARYVELPGIDHLPWGSDAEAILDEIEESHRRCHRAGGDVGRPAVARATHPASRPRSPAA